MSLLSRKIAAEVDKNPGPGPLTVDDAPRRLTLDLTSASPVGVGFHTLDFIAGDGITRSTADLKRWGDGLASRLTYLMEPLVVLEVDAVGGEVELRSQSPSARDTLRSFYEVTLRREGSLHLRRVAFDAADRRRRPIPCQLTREAVERLADDIVAALA